MAQNESPVCQSCGTVMCQQFDERRVNDLSVVAMPNGSFKCYRCGRVEMVLERRKGA